MNTNPSPGNTAVVIVTYGERAALVEKVIEAIAGNGFSRVIIVDNGSPTRNYQKLASIADDPEKGISLIRLERNSGSAGGFSIGIDEASRSEGVQFIWLLDDDNKPVSGAFERLTEVYRYFGNDAKIALLSLRKSRQEYADAARYGKRVSIKKGAFLGFSFSEKIKKILFFKYKPFVQAGVWRYPLITIEYAPYGGLFFSKEMQEKVGLPNTDFFLYSDDHEFTLRWTEHDGAIYLCAMSQIEELEESWGGGENSLMPILMRPDADDVKLYYFVRNRVFLEKRHSGTGLSFWGNAAVYGLAISAIGLWRGIGFGDIYSRLRLIVSAVRDGFSGEFTNGSGMDRKQ